MQTRRSVRWLLVVLLAGCGQESAVGDACSDSSTVSFSHDVVPLIGRCGGELCHGGDRVGASWPYDSLVDVASPQCSDHRALVTPGDPANSYLLQKLEGTNMCSGVRMPKSGSQFQDLDLATIARWICQGALNN